MSAQARSRAPSWGLLAAVTAMLAGCAVGPTYHRPALAPTAGYGDVGAAPEGTRLALGQDIPAAWWEVFHCAALDDLVAEALKNNPTVEAAKAALRAAREQVKAQKGAYYPSVSASLQPTHQDFARDLSSQTASGVSVYDLTTTQVTVAYTPDIFGANARAVEGLVAQADQQRYELAAARVTLAANVVVAAVQDALLRAQIDDTRLIIADQTRTLESFRRQAALGQASRADIAAQEALLAQAKALLPPLEKQFQVNRDLLAALVGRTPGEGVTVAFAFKDLTLPDAVPLSLPARLVEQRPDVGIAEAQLRAASAGIGAALAARLPNIQIDASAGAANLGLAPVFGPASNFWSIAGTLTQPVFEGGTLLHREKAARATYDQAAALYRATVAGAFQNTADVLHALSADADSEAAARGAATAAGASLEIARRQGALGDISFLAVLAAEQADAQARLALLQARANQYADVAALYVALGGGWRSDPAMIKP